MTNTKQNGKKNDLIIPIIPSMLNLLLFNVNSGVQARHQVLSLTPASSPLAPLTCPVHPHLLTGTGIATALLQASFVSAASFPLGTLSSVLPYSSLLSQERPEASF